MSESNSNDSFIDSTMFVEEYNSSSEGELSSEDEYQKEISPVKKRRSRHHRSSKVTIFSNPSPTCLISSSAVGNPLRAKLHDEVNRHRKVLGYSYATSHISEYGKSLYKNIIGKDVNINVEHIYPQSLMKLTDNFGAKRCDLHILYPCDKGLNLQRANYHFDEIPDNLGTFYADGRTAIDHAPNPQQDLDQDGILDIDEECQVYHDAFEPSNISKGKIARALAYYFTMYSQDLCNINRVIETSLLIKWNKEHPVDNEERDRNDKIEEIQGNRNPFVDHSDYLERAFSDLL
jgi:endonuclease I